MARYYEGTRPTSSDATLTASSVINVQMPKSLSVQIRQLSGAKINASMSNPVKFECVLMDNRHIIDPDKDRFFDITWKAHSGKPGVKDMDIGKGRTIVFSPSSIGFDKMYGMSIYAEVKIYAVTALVTSGNQLLISNNKAVTAVKYE